MEIVEKLKEVRVFRDSHGRVTGRKGTTCNVIRDGDRKYVEKQWVTGDWVFSADYEYGVEKHVYQESNAAGLPVPTLFDFDDDERTLRIEYVPGARPGTPCDDRCLLAPVLQFYDRFKHIAFPDALELQRMDGRQIHKYRLDQLQYIFPKKEVWAHIDSVYESFLRDISCFTVPFDRILHNALVGPGRLAFVDFEWTIAGSHEFTLARTAVEFNLYEGEEILARVDSTDLYHLFLLRFYMYGREPESINSYLQGHLQNAELRGLLDVVNAEKYADKPWLSA